MGYQPISTGGTSRAYESYDDQISHYQQLLDKELAREDSNAGNVSYYKDEIARYQKLQRKAQQKELLRTQTHTKISELEQELTSFLSEQQKTVTFVADYFKNNSRQDQQHLLKGTSSDSLRLALADVSLLASDLSEVVDSFK